MPPFMLLNLKKGMIVPLAIELPRWEPQHKSIYAKRAFEEAPVRGMALSHASVSVEGGK
jgi:hypothetical protein